MSTSTLTKLERGRAALISTAPFFACLALGLKVELCDGIETADVDGVTMRANPKFIDDLTGPQVAGLWAHEVMHCAAGHIFRIQGRDLKQWNAACDYVVNDIVRESGLTLPPDHLHDAAYSGKYEEEIYRMLGDKPDTGTGNNAASAAQGAQGTQGTPSGAPGQGGQSQNAPSGPENAPGVDPGRSGGMRRPPAASGAGTPSQAEIAAQAADWQMRATNAATMAQNAGNLPGSLKRMVADMNRPKIGIADILSQFLATSNPSDYSWAMPSRRYLSGGLFLPSLKPDRLSLVVVVIDDSGSISDGVLGRFGAALNETLGDAQPNELMLMCCDRTVSSCRTFEPGDYPVKLDTTGGGGTDFRPPFARLEAEGRTPDALVYLTDLDAPKDRFPAAPGYPVLWLTTDKTFAPFGEVIALPAA